MLHISNFGDL